MNLDGCKVVLTGAAGAIGRATARALIKKGAKVLAVDVDQAGLGALPKYMGIDSPPLRCLNANVADREGAAQIASAAEDFFGTPDALINNAALLSGIGPLWEVDPEKWWADVTTNLLGTFLVTQAFLPAMIEHGEGTIINMVGGGLDRANPGASGYGCSKAALARYTDTLAEELKPWPGLRTFALGPGFVRSTITHDLAAAPDERDWFKYVRQWLEEGKDNPAEGVAEALCVMVNLAERLPSGRVFFHDDDYGQLARDKEHIEEHDIRQVRCLRNHPR